MKRTPLNRRTPLRAGKSQLRRSGRVRPVSPNKKPGVTDAVAQAVIRRSRGICEAVDCPRLATDLHHRVTRARGGPHDEFNLIHLCSECHHVRAHGHNEEPLLIPGHFLHGRYVGPVVEYREHYGSASSIDWD